MPFTAKQHRLFEWASHNPQAAKAQGYDIKPADATRMAGEGIKADPKTLGTALAQFKVQ